MARRSDHSKEELQKLAIEAGVKLIEEQGFNGFSARKVAAEIGYTVGTLYHQFGTLDILIYKINETTLDLWYDTLRSGLEHQKENPVLYLAAANIHFARHHTHRWMSLFEHQPEKSHPVPSWYSDKMVKLFGLAEEALLPHLGHDAAKAKHLAKVLWASIHGICTLSLSGKLDSVGTDAPEVLVASLVQAVLQTAKRS